LFGQPFGRSFYLINGILAIVSALPVLLKAPWWIGLLTMAYAILFVRTWGELYRLQGRALNQTLAHTARNVFLFTLLLVLALTGQG
jgi:1,4-dihydroxy-2-naphthoate octaprenyltransferase